MSQPKEYLYEPLQNEAPITCLNTRSGQRIKVDGMRWRYTDEVTNVNLDFETIREFISEDLLKSLKLVMVWHVEQYAAKTVVNLLQRVKALLKTLHENEPRKINAITSREIATYRHLLGNERIHYLATLRSFFKNWKSLEIQGIADDAIEYLDELRIKNNPRGSAVLTLDPRIGPFSPIELEGLIDALHEAHSDGVLKDDAYHLTLLLIYFGARPVQYAALKTKDLRHQKNEGLFLSFILSIPRAKQGNKNLRHEFTERQMASGTGLPLWNYKQKVEEEALARGIDEGEAPLFPDWSASNETDKQYKYHHATDKLLKMFAKSIKVINIKSERTGKKLHITPVRFRRTLATNAAVAGENARTIAAILDHSDTQTASVYVGATPEILTRIDKAIAMDLAPLAQAFKGQLIDSEKEATRSGDLNSRIVDLKIDRSGSVFGSCGQYSFCGLAAPVACYTCRNFEPWLDAPHERVLDTLLDRREKLQQSGNIRLAEVNDRTILAVAAVITLCQSKKRSQIVET